jgi:hypothetical protein
MPELFYPASILKSVIPVFTGMTLFPEIKIYCNKVEIIIPYLFNNNFVIIHPCIQKH